MQLLHVLTPLAVGGFVGYFTNYIAIKMLFRPSKPVMIGRFRVPFTPGIVPKRKDALAEILGNAVVARFFNADDLEIVFTSEAFTNAFSACIVSLFTDPRATLGALQTDTAGNNLKERIKDEICIRVQAALLRSDVSRLLAEKVLDSIQSRFGNSVLAEAINKELKTLVSEPITGMLEKYILEEGRSFILPILDDELRELSCLPIEELTGNLFSDITKLQELSNHLYQQFMGRYVRRIVESIDVGGMITEKVKLMSAREIESLVVAVVSRELKYVVLLGALIGMLIGAINIII